MTTKPNFTDLPDIELVPLALAGERDALQQLTLRHYAFVYNIAWKMVFNPHDAADLTQEVFVKAITRLAQYRGDSAFRTWLYRIAANHFLNSKKRRTELLFGNFKDYFQVLDEMPDHLPNEHEEAAWAGFVDPDHLMFHADYRRRIRDVAEQEAETALDVVDEIS